MTKLSCGSLWKENNKWENVGLCYIFSTTNLRMNQGVRVGAERPLHCVDCTKGGSQGGGSPPLSGGFEEGG